VASAAAVALLAILLLAANAFYVAAEFALVKSRGFRIKAMVEQDRFGARLLQGMMGNIEAYLACCQLGITMASLGLGWVGEPTVSALLEPLLIPLGMSQRTLHFVSFMAGFLVFSSLHIVIGEQVPKTLAIRQPMPVSQWIAYPLHLSYLVFYPLNWLLNTASRGILRMLGVKESSQHEILTDSEIEGLVEESAVHGGIESGEAEYIHNVFRFGDLAVSDVMVHRTAMMMINADLPPDELVREVLATEYTRIPLWRDKPENIIGVLHAKDLLRAIRASEGDMSRINVSAIMLPPWFVPEMRPLSEQLKAFRRRKTHFALVVDEAAFQRRFGGLRDRMLQRRAAWSDLRKGVLISGVGFALSVHSLMTSRSPNVVGLVLLFVGLGFVVLWWFEQRHLVPPAALSRDAAPGPGSTPGSPPSA